ncbi:MAG: thiol peroxidase [Chloroflexi bacterium]|nr:thiol peroxidase [Chloroflexota bacterium]
MERSGLLKFSSQDVTIIGLDVKVGEMAEEFTVHDQSWKNLKILKATAGKVRILAAVPSLETSVCDTETRRFNQEAAGLSEDIIIVTISTDLPFAQKRWCGAAGIDRVMVVSDHYNTDFGVKYGCLIKEQRLLRRAAFVVDRDDLIVYVEYLPALGEEPNYDAVLNAARKALN